MGIEEGYIVMASRALIENGKERKIRKGEDHENEVKEWFVNNRSKVYQGKEGKV